MRAPRLIRTTFFTVLALAGAALPAFALPEITLTGDQQQGPITPDPNGRYTFVNVPLRKNSVNRFTVTAKDGNQVQTKEIRITQVSLESVVVSKIKAEPLSVQQIEQLVADGTIKLDDPANFNVSKFEIVLTIGHREVPISVPIVTPKEEPMGFEEIPPVNDPGNGNSSTPNPPDIVIFELTPPPIPGEPPPPPIPGVLIIEGRIKTLKEFYSVRLLLMNTSGIFTLHDVTANIEFPDKGLSSTLPADGIVQYGDILPGTGDEPGQKEREFIVRGDEIGTRAVKVNFGGTLIGPGIPDDEPVPFNGSAQTTVEVKGPPEFRVQVIHPPEVTANVPYELLVDITNVGDTPALYTSFELDAGADGYLVDCGVTSTGLPECKKIDGSAVRNIGHLMPGDTTRQSFTINPLTSGPITSCMSIADQNIDLQVFVGSIGCLAGRRPPAEGTADGVPTLSVLPTANALGVSIETPVVAFFNELMNTGTITTGEGGTFNVFDDADQRVAGQLRFETLDKKTIAIWQPTGGPLAGNRTFRVNISNAVSDQQGYGLAGAWVSEFTTTDPTNDVTPPTLTLAIEPPVNPAHVLPGQIIRLNAYAADQGSALNRIELRMQDADVPGSAFALVDQKMIFPTTAGPYIFSVDSSKLVPGHIYQFKATAFDNASNSQDATLAAVMALSAAPPSITLPADPVDPVLQGISVTLMPQDISESAKTVDYYLDSQAQPFKTVTLPPFSATLGTLNLGLGAHTIRAVATDGLGQTGQDTFGFTLAKNPNEPVVDFGGLVNGSKYVSGMPVNVNGGVTDPVGIASAKFVLDNVNAAPLATSTEPFTIDTTGLTPGVHRLYFQATNRLGVANDLTKPSSYLEFEVVPVPGQGTPPAAPAVSSVSVPVNGKVTVKGTSVPGARIDVKNKTQGFLASVYADNTGAFEAVIDAASGDILSLSAVNLSQSQTPGAAVEAAVPAAPVLDHITVNPAAKTFTQLNQFQDISVTGVYAGGASQDLTSQASFTSSDPSVASVNAAGRVAALKGGAAVITAKAGGKQAAVSVTVSVKNLSSIMVDQGDFHLIGAGKTRQLSVTGHYSDGSTAVIPAANLAFASSDLNAAAVNADGLVTAIAPGSAVITVSGAGVSPAQSVVTIEQIVPTGISVSPNAILFTSAGETRTLDVKVNFSDGTQGPPAGAVDFKSGNLSAATVDASGLVTAAANGNSTVTVTYAGFTATVSVVVDIHVNNVPPPEIASIDRPRAGEGDLFVLRGSNFAAVPGDNKVLVNGVQAEVQAARQDELSVVVPKGASSGPVTVTVDKQTSNEIQLVIYSRKAKGYQITPAVDMPASAGQQLVLPGPSFEFRQGDRVFLSSAPDILAPLSFSGVLQAQIDGGAFFTINPSANAPELTSSFSVGSHTVTVRLSESGGKFTTAALYLAAGPDATGVFSGARSVMANAQTRPTPVTFINLKDSGGNPLPDGSKVVVTAEAHCFRDPVSHNCVDSRGGTITNGPASPDGFGLKVFTVTGGRIDVIYDPAAAQPLGARDLSNAAIQVLPANASGNRTSDIAIALANVSLTAFDTVGTSRSQTSAVADGNPKIVTVTFTGARDTAGELVPDGTPVLVTVEAHCFRDPDAHNCVDSAGGSILSGDASPDGFGLRRHVLANGEVSVQYSPGGKLLPFPEVAAANLQWLPSVPGGQRIGDIAFQLTPVTLSSARSPAISAPSSVFADTGDNRVVITLSGFKDALGAPVPDGTKINVTAEEHCFRDPVTTGCIPSAGGVIVSGTPSPDGFGLKTHEVQNGQVQVTYSAQGLGMQTLQSALVSVQVLPSQPNGQRIGDRALALAQFTAAGYQAAVVSASPAAVVADGLTKNVTITLSNIRDTEGNVVPDGALVLLTAGSYCFRDPVTTACIPSAGGVITSGTPSPDGFGLRAHVVVNGQVTASYDPGSVTMQFPDTGVANVQVLPGRPSDGGRIGDRAFAVIPVTLSSVQQASVSIVPSSVLADSGDNRVTVTLSNIKDGAGNPVPDGTKVVATAGAFCFRDPATNNCVDSAGGTIKSGTPSPDGFGLQAHTIQGGSTQITYSAQPVSLEARQAATAEVQILPAQPGGQRVGNRAFTLAPVILAGYQSADIAGPGQVAPGASANYVVSNIRDTSGNLVPDGSKILVTAGASCFRDPETNNCIDSAGGSITNGTDSPDGFGLKVFAVSGGQITVQFQAPGGAGTSVLQFLPGRPDNSRTGNKAFTLKAVSVQP